MPEGVMDAGRRTLAAFVWPRVAGVPRLVATGAEALTRPGAPSHAIATLAAKGALDLHRTAQPSQRGDVPLAAALA